jgi:hypothetical protein
VIYNITINSKQPTRHKTMNTTTTQLTAIAIWSDSLGGYDPNPWNWEIAETAEPVERGCVPANKELAIKVAPECVD